MTVNLFITVTKFIKNETDFDSVLECYKRHRVDSFSDLPGNYFWEEFFERCPNSKVRNNPQVEEIWPIFGAHDIIMNSRASYYDF